MYCFHRSWIYYHFTSTP